MSQQTNTKLDWTIEIDTHTHSVLSGHAWSTLKENCESAAQKGLKGVCLTEHGPAMPHSIPNFGAAALNLIPNNDAGVAIIRGMELNIIDYDGNLDVDKTNGIHRVEFGIASLHDITILAGTIEQNTAAYLCALENPYVDILGHPGFSHFPTHHEEIVLAAKKHNKLIEINNNSFLSRPGSKENCADFANLCRKHDVRICVSSDAHYHTRIGEVSLAQEMLRELNFPSELILNSKLERFNDYLTHERLPRLPH